MQYDKAFPVMVLAHNEEGHIGACLDSIFSSDPELPLEVFVMANGCTDSTASVVEQYTSINSNVKLISIEMPDKCNAWNVFIHDIVSSTAADRSAYFFMDGDARVTRGSFSALLNGLSNNPSAHAASAPPASGRSLNKDRRILLEERHLVANLYALRGSFVESLREKCLRLPLGLEGDDGLIGALVKWDLDPVHKSFNDNLIEPCPEAGFVFESMSLFRPRDWLSYWKRAVRYGRRRYEFQLLGEQLRRHGVAGLPEHISALYSGAHKLNLMWDGVYTISNWFALRELRRPVGTSSGGA